MPVAGVPSVPVLMWVSSTLSGTDSTWPLQPTGTFPRGWTRTPNGLISTGVRWLPSQRGTSPAAGGLSVHRSMGTALTSRSITLSRFPLREGTKTRLPSGWSSSWDAKELIRTVWRGSTAPVVVSTTTTVAVL